MNIDEAYSKYTKHTQLDGRYQIECVKGLFGVDAPTKEQAENEAKHYFWQYFEDGEYSILDT